MIRGQFALVKAIYLLILLINHCKIIIKRKLLCYKFCSGVNVSSQTYNSYVYSQLEVSNLFNTFVLYTEEKKKILLNVKVLGIFPRYEFLISLVFSMPVLNLLKSIKNYVTCAFKMQMMIKETHSISFAVVSCFRKSWKGEERQLKIFRPHRQILIKIRFSIKRLYMY